MLCIFHVKQNFISYFILNVLKIMNRTLITRKISCIEEPSADEDFRNALKNPDNGQEQDQGGCNGKRDNGLKYVRDALMLYQYVRAHVVGI